MSTRTRSTASRPAAVCLVSGGMDSCVSAACARRDCDPCTFLHVNYGQRTVRRELEAFHAIADRFAVADRVVLDLDHIRRFGGSSLLRGGPEVPVVRRPTARAAGVPSTYVPFRNGTLLAVATALAEVRGASRIYIGAVEEDSSGYPDCTAAFFRAFNRAIATGTRAGGSIRVVTPVIRSTKADIVRLGSALGAPLELTWSCYRSEDAACGRCDSCLLRLRAFRAAGVEDPIPYAVRGRAKR